METHEDTEPAGIRAGVEVQNLLNRDQRAMGEGTLVTRLKWRLWSSGFLAALLSAPAPLSGQSKADTATFSIAARVVDALTQEGLSRAVVRIPGLSFAAITDDRGGFTLDSVRVGEYRVSVARPGYRAAEGVLKVEGEGTLLFHMTPEEALTPGPVGSILGRVLDQDSGDPLPSATVRLLGLGQRRMTNRRGWFEFPSVPPGPHLLSVESLGYAVRTDSLFLLKGQILDVTVPLTVEPIALDGITVMAQPSWLGATGFFRRRERTAAYSGRQWTREEIEARNPVFVQDVLMATPGILPSVSQAGEKVLLGRGKCRLEVYVNDVLMTDFDLDALDPAWVEALEIYQGNSVFMPFEYGMKHCGVILIWLKRRP